MYNWQNTVSVGGRKYICGYCSSDIVSNEAFLAGVYPGELQASIFICHFCGRPTFFDYQGSQYPAPKYGGEVEYIPETIVKDLYNEARSCFSVHAYNAVVMCCRKLLMNIAIEKGAHDGLKFVQYVDYLEAQNLIIQGARPWVDKIRDLGNNANHRIDSVGQESAKLALDFSEMLLKSIFEMPGKLP